MLGCLFNTNWRYLQWLIDRTPQAQLRKPENLLYLVFRHQTPLSRPFSEVPERLSANKIANLQLAVDQPP